MEKTDMMTKEIGNVVRDITETITRITGRNYQIDMELDEKYKNIYFELDRHGDHYKEIVVSLRRSYEVMFRPSFENRRNMARLVIQLA